MKKKIIAAVALGAILLAVILIIVIGKKEVSETPLVDQTENTEAVATGKKPSTKKPVTVEEAKESLGVSVDSKKFTNTNPGFSIEYPTNFTVNTGHVYKGMGPGNDISGVAFYIPTATTKGTNLSADSYISFEKRSMQDCVASDFLHGVSVTEEAIVMMDGIPYRVASKTETTTGNTYAETVYVDDNCNAIRYFIHSTTSESLKQFDMDAVLAIFNDIRDSYILKK